MRNGSDRDDKAPAPVPSLDIRVEGPVKVTEEKTLEGKKVVILAEESIEIRCGKSSLVLTKEGRAMINGAFVSVSSDGVIRLDGGSIQMN